MPKSREGLIDGENYYQDAIPKEFSKGQDCWKTQAQGEAYTEAEAEGQSQ
jgi:hypothetical protein